MSPGLFSENPAVGKAYEERVYTDKEGREWRRGLDGWFDDGFEGGIYMIRHDDFVDLVVRENPVP